MIELKDISLSYGRGTGATNALKQVNLVIDNGEFVAIVGKSGCGKSSLLSVIGGIMKPNSGKYLFNGTDVYKESDYKLARFRNHNIGYVVQNYAMLNDMTVEQNVMLPLRYAKCSAKDRRETAIRYLGEVGLEDKRACYPGELSGGECQRVAIARALINKPSVILADEPTGSLDEENGSIIMNMFERLHEAGNTIILVTHDKELAVRAERIIDMRDGYIVGERCTGV